MRSCSVLMRHEPSSGNDRTTLGVFTKSSFSRFLSTPGSCWSSLRLPYLRLPYLQQVWLHSPNLLQVWLFLPHLQQVWLTQDQLGAFPATPSTALYLPHKIRTHEALFVARKPLYFSPRSHCRWPHSQSTRVQPTHTRLKQRDLNYLKPTPSTASFCAKPYTYY